MRGCNSDESASQQTARVGEEGIAGVEIPQASGKALSQQTFGVRRMEVDRAILARESKTVDTPWGAIRVKVGSRGGVVLTASPEHEDLKEAAARSGIPLRDLHARVMEVYRRGS